MFVGQVRRPRRICGGGLGGTGAGAGGWGELGPELSVCADPNRSGAVVRSLHNVVDDVDMLLDIVDMFGFVLRHECIVDQ